MKLAIIILPALALAAAITHSSPVAGQTNIPQTQASWQRKEPKPVADVFQALARANKQEKVASTAATTGTSASYIAFVPNDTVQATNYVSMLLFGIGILSLL